MAFDTASFDQGAHAFIRELRSVSFATAQVPHDREARLSDPLISLMQSCDGGSPSAMRELVEGLCELALDPDPERSDLGQQLMFNAIVEYLADSFEPEKARLYDRLFALVIDHYRRHRTGRRLDFLLSRFGVSSPDDLLARKERLTIGRPFPIDERSRIQRVFVPSRVTLGADVAVTSVVLQKIERVFPQAECVVFGPAAVGELLEGAATTVRFVECSYHRRGGLIARLDSWIQLVEAVQAEMDSREVGACLLLDPDSRLTQLGLLPLVPDEVPSFFFESRAYRRPGAETLGELTALWLNDILGPDDGAVLYPRVVPATSVASAARTVTQHVRASGAGHVTTMTLGVGGNARKSIAGRFEGDLLRALISEGGAVILDKGIDEEVARVEAIVAALAAERVRVVELEANPLRLPDGASGQLLLHRGGLRSLVALVAASDLYVGYDSAFQHIAAALGVPVIDVFVNPPNDLFSKRWRPYSTAVVEVVQVGADDDGRETLPRVLAAYRASRERLLRFARNDRSLRSQ